MFSRPFESHNDANYANTGFRSHSMTSTCSSQPYVSASFYLKEQQALSRRKSRLVKLKNSRPFIKRQFFWKKQITEASTRHSFHCDWSLPEGAVCTEWFSLEVCLCNHHVTRAKGEKLSRELSKRKSYGGEKQTNEDRSNRT